MRKSYLLSIFWAFSIVLAWGQNENWIDKADINWYTEHENDETYEISTAAQLAGLAKLTNKGAGDENPVKFTDKIIRLTADISLNEGKKVLNEDGELVNDGNGLIAWTPIGAGGNPFSGTFDGNGYVVKGIYIREESNFIGLFGMTESNGEIKNVGVVDSYIEGNYNVGGVCGLTQIPISNCYNAGSVIGNKTDIGGVCGGSHARISNCYNTGNIKGNGYSVGGVVGTSHQPITDCHNTGNVIGNDSESTAGGIVGITDYPISNCYNTGDITGYSVAGIVGLTISTITNCYNTGNITGNGGYASGIAGDVRSIAYCYNTGNITGSKSQAVVGGICGCSLFITHSYNMGYITGSGNNVGGICGISGPVFIAPCYLIGSADKGIGHNNDGSETIPLTAQDLVAAMNEAFKDTDWQGEATYKNGILSLPTLDNETAQATKLATLTEDNAIKIDYAAETITVKGNSKFDVSYTTDFNLLISSGNAIHPEEIIYARHTGGSKDGLISDILKITLPARPATPKAPTTASITTDAITLTTADSNAQYSRTDGRTWQTSPTFSNLMPETNYTFFTRIRATSTGFASFTSEPATFRTAAIGPISYSYTIPNTIGAIVEGAGSSTAREGSRITFRVKLDPNGNGIYPAARINNQTDVRHEGNGFYSFYISAHSEVSIDEVDYTLYNVTCPTDTVFDSITDTYSTGAGIRVTDAKGHQANAFPYGSTIRLNAPDNTFRRFRHWWDLSRNRPYEIVLTDHLEATATFEALHPVANETISMPGLRITSGHGYVEVETPRRLPIRLYHISGRLLHQADQAGTIRFGNLTTGTYLLTAGTERQLILVR